MNLLRTAIESEFACRLGWALVHSLWLGFVCAAVLMAGMVILRRRSANARYLCACAAMLLLLSASAAMYFLASVPKKPQAGMATPAGAASPRETPLLPAPRIHHVDPPSSAGPIPEHDKPASPAAVLPPEEPVGAPSGVPASSPRPLFARAAESIEPALPWVVMAWMVGVVLAALWQMSSWLSAMRIRRLASLPDHSGLAETAARLARLLGLSRPAKVLQSMILKTPAVIGLLRPVILLPASLCTALPPAQLEAILLHELAHIRRMDYLVNLLQTLVETLLFYHPAVWYISSRIRLERENCCDDITIAHCDDATLYADALASTAAAAKASASFATHGKRRPRKPATAISADGGKLLPRIRRILGQSDQQPARSTLLSTAIALSLVLALIALPLALSVAAPNTPTQPAATGAANQHTWTLPELSFLAWQEDQPAMAVNAVPRAWRPDGQLADSPDEQRTLRSVQGMRCSGPDPPSRFLQLWFFHPEADNRSTIKCTLRDDQGRTLQGQPAAPFGWRVQEGWLLICLPAAPSQQPVPPAINIELQYAVGPWQEIGSVSPTDESPSLPGLFSVVLGPDQRAEPGAPGTSIAFQRTAGQADAAQYSFVAITNDGKELASRATYSWELKDNVVREAHFFASPISAIKSVSARRRALQAVTFRNVSIEPGVRTNPSVQRETPESPATQPAAPGGLRSRDLSGTWAGDRDGVKARIVFRGDDDASWRIEAPRATIGASLKLVDDQQSGTVGLRLDHFASATGKHGSTVIGKLERNASGPLSLTILPAAAELESDYQPASQIPLQKISASSSTGPTTQASSDTILWGGVVEGRQYGISLDREGRECRLGDRLALKFHVRNAGQEAIEETVYPAGGQWSISHTNENGTQAIHILPMSSPSSRPATWAVPTSADHLLPPLGSDPRIVRIAPGQAVAVGQIELNLPKPAEAAALFAAVKPGQCIIRYQHHIPGTFAYQPPISGPLVINVLPATSSQPATQSATGKVAHATNLASERWGPATEGLTARLQCDKLVWATKEAVVVQVDLRNMGKADWTFPLTQQGLDIEVDGEEYEWDGPVENPGQTIGPAQAVAGILVVLDGHWVKKGAPATKLVLGRGKHCVRVKFSAVPVNGTDEVDVFSNRVSFWVLPADYADQVAKQSEQFIKAVINITQLGEANARVEVFDPVRMRELLAFFPDLGRKSGTAAGWEAGGTIELTKRDATTTKIVLSGNDNLNTWSAGQGDWSVCGDFLAYFTKLQQTATQPATQPATATTSVPATQAASIASAARSAELDRREAASMQLGELISNGRIDEALAFYRRQIVPDRLPQLGEALKGAGRGLEMLELYHEYLLTPPPPPDDSYPLTYNRLGRTEELFRQIMEVAEGQATAKRLEEKIAAAPHEAWPHLRLGYLRWCMGERAKALAEFNRYAELWGEPSAGWLGWLADLCRQAGLAEQAIAYYKRALEAPFTDEDVRAASSMSAVLRTPETIRSDAKARLLMGLAATYRSIQRWPEAQQCYEQVLELAPPTAQADAQKALAEVFKAQGKRNPLIDQLEGQLKTDPKNADLHARLAVLLLAAGESQQGIDHYRQASNAAPERLEHRLNLADALLAVGKAKEALEEYAATLKAAAGQDSPTGRRGDMNVTPEMVLGRLRRLDDRTELQDDLLKLYRSILEFDQAGAQWKPSEYTIRNVLQRIADILSRRADYAGIVDLWLEHRKDAPTIARDQIRRYLNRLDSLDSLIARLGKLSEVDVAEVSCRFILGDALAAAGRAQDALAVYEDLSRQHPNDESVRRELAAIYDKMGQHQLALRQNEALLKLYPSGSEQYTRTLGLVAGLNLRMGNRTEAARQYREALKFDPLNANYLKGLRDADGEAVPATTPAATQPAADEKAALRTQAGELLAKNHYDQAAEVFRRILVSRPTDVEAMVMLGKCYLQGGQKEKVVAAFERAYQMRRWSNTNYDIRQQLERLYQESEAKDKLLALYTEDRDWQSVRQLYKNQPEKYTQFLNDQLRKNAGDVQLRFCLAEDALDRNKPNEAQPILEQLEAEMTKDGPVSAERLADGFERLDQSAHALKLLDAAAYAQRPDPNDWLGSRFMRLYAKTGQPAKVMEVCARRLQKDPHGYRTIRIAEEIAEYAATNAQGRALLEAFMKDPGEGIVPKVATRFAGAVRAKLGQTFATTHPASGPGAINPVDMLKQGRVVAVPAQARTLLDYLDALAASAGTAVDQSFRSARPLPAPKLVREQGPALELLAEALTGLPVTLEFSQEGYWMLYEQGDPSARCSLAASGGAIFTLSNGGLLRKSDGKLSGMGHLLFDSALKPHIVGVGMFPRTVQVGEDQAGNAAPAAGNAASPFDPSGMVSFCLNKQPAETKTIPMLKLAIDVAVCTQWKTLTSDALDAAQPMLLKDPTCTATIGPAETIDSAGKKFLKIHVTINGRQKWEPRIEFITSHGKTLAWSNVSRSRSQDKAEYNLQVRLDALTPSALKLVIHLPDKVEVVPVDLVFKDVPILDKGR